VSAPPVTPLRIEPAYRHRDAVWARVLGLGPYRLMSGLAGYGAMSKMTAMPWFREHWALDGQPRVDGIEELLHNEEMVAAARRMFGAEVVRPATLLVNLMGPMAEGVPHVDTPSFRGLARDAVPIWLLLVMGASGLFARWQIRVAGAVTWFYERPDGAFEYWPENRAGGSRTEAAPFGNSALITDSDRMFHRVRRIGSPGDPLTGASFGASSRLRFDGGPEALVLDGERVAARYASDQIRVSLLWKALVFATREDARAFDRGSDDLSLEQVFEIFSGDLRARGIEHGLPADPLEDPDWSKLLLETYPFASLPSD
jgi:hypothetical protein